MLKNTFFYFLMPAFLALVIFAYFSKIEDSPMEMPLAKQISEVNAEPSSASQNSSERKVLAVPFVSEAPEGIWTQPWANACEEATVMMVDRFYTGAKSVSVPEAKAYLLDLFDKEEALFGTWRNADASQIAQVVDGYTSFKAEIKTNPTLGEIKGEIDAGRPMISLHRGFDLQNPNIEFSPTLSSYHTLVVVGYDDVSQAFITHDPGDEKEGEFLKYSYDVFMNSLHDYNAADNKADGVPTVIFTKPK